MLRLLGDIIESDDELNVVGVARDGEEAYHVIKAKEPDVVLLDIVMPKLDGLGVLDRVSQDTSIKKHPAFIMISAIGQEKITEDAFARGADYYIMKPFDNDIVLSRIKNVRRPAAGRGAEVRKINAYEKAEETKGAQPGSGCHRYYSRDRSSGAYQRVSVSAGCDCHVRQ